MISKVYGYGGKNAKRTVQESTTVCNEAYYMYIMYNMGFMYENGLS